jgi:hypothetical protein
MQNKRHFRQQVSLALEVNKLRDLHREWQRIWREALGETVESMPDEVECDFALHFDIWKLNDQELRQCFSLFPDGQKILDRAVEVITSSPRKKEVDDENLLTLLDEMNRSAENVIHLTNDQVAIRLNNEKLLCKSHRVYRGDENLRVKLFQNVDRPTIHLDDELSKIIQEKKGDIGYAAFFFLSEPLYRLANNYSVSNWVIWAMLENEFDVDPYKPGYELYKLNAEAGWSSDEMFIFVAE